MRPPVILDYPLILFVVSLVLLALAAWFGASILGRNRNPDDNIHDDYTTILAATLTLLGLIIGFSFSMAISRYDQRKNLEEEEANAIGTAYVRADLLPAADATRVRALLKEYVDMRMEFYRTQSREDLGRIAARRAKLQADLWTAVQGPATAQPTAMMALVTKGMNDVLNAQGYTQAAWWNRIPHAAWLLMMLIAICCNMLIGYGTQGTKASRRLLLVTPVVVSISFMLIADIDSPRGGLIHVSPLNLQSLAESLRSPSP
jgi:hypothetical protein